MNNLRRLHPSALLISFISAIKSSIIPIIAVLFLSSEDSSFLFRYAWLIILVFAGISTVITWFTFYYRLHEGELYIQKGIFVKKKKYIQKQRVQSIDIKAGVIQRLFGMVSVEIQTAGGGSEAEAELSAITRAEAEAIRKELLDRGSKTFSENQEENIDGEAEMDVQAKPYSPQHSWELGTERLIAMSLTSSGIGLIFSAVGAVLSQVSQFIPNEWYDSTFGFVSRIGFSLVLAISGFVLLALFISWVLASVISIIKYGGFKIDHYGSELVISRGLLERRQLTLQLNRITSVRLVQNLLRQPLGFVSVYVESAGGGTKDEQASTLLIPLVKKSELQSVLAEIIPNYAFDKEYQPLPKKALWRLQLRYLWFPTLLTAVAIYFFPTYGFFGLILIVFASILAWFTYKAGGSGSSGDYMWIRYRSFSLIEVMAPRWKVQAAEKRISFLQSWQNLATFKVTVQSSLTGKVFYLSDLANEDADRMLKWYSYTEQKPKSL